MCVCVPKCSLIKLLLYILFEKYIYILTLEMANPGNQHCASCIGTLSFPIRDVTYVVNMFDEAVQRSRRAAALLTYRAGARACVCRHEVLVRRVRQVVLSAAEPRHPRQHAPRRPPCTAPRARLRHLPQEVRKYALASLLLPAAAVDKPFIGFCQPRKAGLNKLTGKSCVHKIGLHKIT